MTETERIPDLGVDILEDGSINLEQNTGCGEMAYVTLHPCQLRLIAERAGLLKPPATAELPAGLIRRLERLGSRAWALYELLASVGSYPPHADLDEDVQAALDLVESFEDLFADYCMPIEDGSHGKSDAVTENAPPSGISVTQTEISVTTPARGRPRSPTALTPAQRQAKRRAKQATLDLETTP